MDSFGWWWWCWCSITCVTVVSQEYDTDVNKEYIIRGNSALLKCQFPSFMADHLQVESWMIDDGTVVTQSELYGTSSFKETITRLLLPYHPETQPFPQSNRCLIRSGSSSTKTGHLSINVFDPSRIHKCIQRIQYILYSRWMMILMFDYLYTQSWVKNTTWTRAKST
jgi:hypothetical protein